MVVENLGALQLQGIVWFLLSIWPISISSFGEGGGELFEVFAVDGWGLRERVIFLMELFDRTPVW